MKYVIIGLFLLFFLTGFSLAAMDLFGIKVLNQIQHPMTGGLVLMVLGISVFYVGKRREWV